MRSIEHVPQIRERYYQALAQGIKLAQSPGAHLLGCTGCYDESVNRHYPGRSPLRCSTCPIKTNSKPV